MILDIIISISRQGFILDFRCNIKNHRGKEIDPLPRCYFLWKTSKPASNLMHSISQNHRPNKT